VAIRERALKHLDQNRARQRQTGGPQQRFGPIAPSEIPEQEQGQATEEHRVNDLVEDPHQSVEKGKELGDLSVAGQWGERDAEQYDDVDAEDEAPVSCDRVQFTLFWNQGPRSSRFEMSRAMLARAADRAQMSRPALLVALAIPLLLASTPEVACAQNDAFNSLHATLRGWEERARLTILDRDGSYFGRTSERGILQRFNEKMDSEYPLDLISSSFSLGATYEWYQRDDGVRFWAGSINHLQLIQQGDAKAMVPLGGTWTAGAHFVHDESLEAKRNLIELEFRKGLFDGRARAFLLGTLNAEKSQSDVELGFSWLPGHGTVTVAFAALDLVSDLIYQSLEIEPYIADTTLNYGPHPYTARLALDLPVGPRLRVEAYALAMTPTTVVVESQTEPGVGFNQDERYAYAGGLLEWAPTPRIAAGAFGTWVRARSRRSALLPEGSPEDDFDLTEKTWQFGVYGIGRPHERWTAEIWLARVWRTEDRLRPATAPEPDIDHEDRTWAGRAHVFYQAPGGLRGDLAFFFTDREIVGPDPLPGARAHTHTRLRFDFGWAFGGRALLMAGTNLDVDGDGRAPNFDGAHGRFLLYW
jgi:hypothetical protein